MNKKDTQNNKVNKGKILSGIVRSVKMKDTVVVEVNRYFKHKKYEKFISVRKRYKAHDVGNTAGLGDKVEIIECRPISRDKRFKLLSIVSKAPSAEVTEDNQ